MNYTRKNDGARAVSELHNNPDLDCVLVHPELFCQEQAASQIVNASSGKASSVGPTQGVSLVTFDCSFDELVQILRANGVDLNETS